MPESPTKPFSGIFVSYRRDDCAGHAGRLFDRLVQHFGPERIFMDVNAIEPGEDFKNVIENAVGSCGILIAMIGREWLVNEREASRFMDNPHDYVRLEIANALVRDIRVIPVLVQRASMPKPEDLPDDVVAITRRNAIELTDPGWTSDVDRLIGVLERVLIKREEAEATRRATSTSGAESDPLEEKRARDREGLRSQDFEGQRPAVPALIDIASVRIRDVGHAAQPTYWGTRKLLFALLAGVVAVAVIALVWRMATRLRGSDPKTPPSASPSPQPAVSSLSAAENAARGFDLLNHDKYGEAVPYLREAVRQSPFTADYYSGLGVALYLQEKYVDAEPYLRKGVTLEPTNANHNEDLGNVLAKQAKYAEATTFHREASRLRPKNAIFANQWGIDLYFQQKYAEAEKPFRHAVRIQPDNAGYLHDLGNALYKQGKYREAEAPYRRAVQIDPNAPALNDLGNTLYKLGKNAEAKIFLSQAVQRDPNNQNYQGDLKRVPHE